MPSATATLQFDDEAARTVEALYSTHDVMEQRRAVLRALALERGERVLDIGSGPGFLAAEMAAVVGPAGAVAGADVSESMIELARRRVPAPGSAPVRFELGDALALPFADATFDAAVSTQVYEYVEDIPHALAEARRVLRPGGRLLVLDTDWDSVVWRSSDDERMGRVMRAWDDHLVHRDLPRRLPQLLREGGFALTACSIVPLLNVGYRPETYSAKAIGLIGRYVAAHEDADADEVAAWAQDLETMGADAFFSLCRYLFVAVR